MSTSVSMSIESRVASSHVVLCFDTETTGKPPNNERYFNEKNGAKAESWPRIIQLAFILYDTGKMKQLAFYDKLVKLKPDELVPPDSTAVHGITDKDLEEKGISIRSVMKAFIQFFDKADFVVGHNVQFDINVVCAELTLLIRDPETSDVDKRKMREIIQKLLWDKTKRYCTLNSSRKICNLPKYVYDINGVVKDETGIEVIDYTLDNYGKRKIRNPRLETAHQVLFQQKSNGQLHNALVDVAVCLRIFLKLYKSVDVCDSEHLSANKFICDTINPSDLKPSEVPRRIGEPTIHRDVIQEMNAISFRRDSRYTKSSRKNRKVRSLSLRRTSTKKSNKKTRSL
jgi:DNA polymerase III epsilon subunit-like protein